MSKPTTPDLSRLSAEEKRALLDAMLRKKRLAEDVALQPISRRPEGAQVPLSFAQERLWFLQRLEPTSAAYHVPMTWRVEGPFDPDRFTESWRRLAARHESLRTLFTESNGRPVQVVLAEPEFECVRADFSERAGEAAEEAARAWILEASIRPMDLAVRPAVRVGLARVTSETWLVLVNLHHLITDEVSGGLIVGELRELYAALTSGRDPQLPSLPIQFGDYAVWQREWLKGPILEKQEAYWRRQLEGLEGALSLPTDRPRPAIQQVAGARCGPFDVPAHVLEGLHRVCREEGVTLFMLLQTAFHVLLHRLSGQEDLAVGTPVAGRTRREVEGMIGCFINTLVLRVPVSGTASFRQVLAKVKAACLGAYEHQDVPFERLVEVLKPRRDLSRAPYFQAMFSMAEGTAAPDRIGDVAFISSELGTPFAKFDLSLFAEVLDDRIRLSFEYATALFDRETVATWGAQLVRLLGAIGAGDGTGTAVWRLPLLDAAGEREMLDSGRAPRVPTEEAGIMALLRRQVIARGSATALSDDGRSVDYAALWSDMGRVAARLGAAGLGPGDVVGVLGERGLPVWEVVLGVWRAGGAYMPLDEKHPAERWVTVIRESGAGWVAVEARLQPALLAALAAAGLGHVQVLTVESLLLPGDVEDIPLPEEHGAGLAYVLFTSGSTGVPKGAMSTMQGLVNHLEGKRRVLGLGPDDVVAQSAPRSFDISVWQLLAALLVGGRTHVVATEVVRDPTRLLAEVESAGVTILELVPSLLGELHVVARRQGSEAVRLERLRWLVPTGEALTEKVATEWFSLWPHVPLMNAYGPAECSDAVLLDVLHEAPGGVPVLGAPVPNVHVYVLGPHFEICGPGVSGELYIGGAQVGRGYAGQFGLTAERFVPDPHALEAGARMYRTGDLVRRRRDGGLEYQGRADFQVKVRGQRLELGEVEAAIEAQPGVRQAVVVVRGEGAGAQLVGYVVPGPDVLLSLEALREGVRAKLPEYMIPAAWALLEALPHGPNGKVDRKALPTDVVQASAAAYEAPVGPTETRLAGVWSELLGVARVGRDDDFFELGGHSLLATRAISRVREELGVELPLRVLFEGRTLRAMADAMGAAGMAAATLVPVVRPPEGLPLSFAQERFWFLQELDPSSAAYNVILRMHLEGPLEVPALQQALRGVMQRHEVLRTVFHKDAGRPLQRVLAGAEPEWTTRDFNPLGEHERKAALDAFEREEANRPFRLDAGPLLRAGLARSGSGSWDLQLVLHHALTDGWSDTLLLAEVWELYASAVEGRPSTLEPLPLQYGDFAAWQRSDRAARELSRQEAYWRDRLEGLEGVLQLPLDRPRPAIQRHEGALAGPVRLDAAVTRGLKQLCQREGVTLFMLLEAAFHVLLHRLTGQEDLAVGTPLAGRNRRETEGLIGCFVNTLVVRAKVDPRRTFRELLEDVKHACLGAYEHQDLPFERLVELLNPERDLSRTPLVQVLFVLQNVPLQAPGGAGGLTVVPHDAGVHAVPYDLTVNAQELGDTLELSGEFASALFDEGSVVGWLRAFAELLADLAQGGSSRPVWALPIWDDTARRQVTDAFNDTARPVDADTLVGLFEARVALDPQAPAVEFEGTVQSYAELDRRANALAWRLRRLGVGPECRVGVLMERSAELVAALLGILKAGAAYVPLDAGYPPERLAYMAQDANLAALVLDAQLSGLVEFDGPHVVADDAVADAGPGVALVGANAAYAIYTSGSTGRPKGAINTHEGIANRLAWARELFRMGPGERVLQKTPVSFDVSVWEIFGPLTAGATLVIARPGGHQEADYLVRTVEQARITTMHFVPAMLAAFLEGGGLEGLGGLRRVVCSGEALSLELVARLRQRMPWVELHNLYGPTEAAVDVTAWRCPPELPAGTVPLGRPTWNVRTYVLDRWLQPVACGIAGELHLAGVQLGRGYLERPDLTAERWIPSPFGVGERLYRTGDLARWRADGQLEYLGRTDFQVKLRGLRIELGEIESALEAQPGIKQAVVVARGEGPRAHLVGYLVPRVGAAPPVEAVRAGLRERLPEHMIPTAWALLESLPLTPSGKVDRRALPDPQGAVATAAYEAPEGASESLVARVWAGLLDLPRVGRHDDFFELGGHSLLATQVRSRLREELALEVSLRELFQARTVEALGALLDAAAPGSGSGDGPLARVERDPSGMPLSFAQERLWFLHQVDPGSAASHVALSMRLDGDLDAPALERALAAVAERHEILRTVLVGTREGPRQRVLPGWAPEWTRVDVSDLSGEVQTRALQTWLSRLQAKPFSLERDPPVRAGLARLGEGAWALLLVVHHAATDGWSEGILLRELWAAYAEAIEGRPASLPALPIQYADWAAWQRERLSREHLATQEAYWRAQLAGLDGGLELPTDRPRPAIRDGAGATLTPLRLAPAVVQGLRRLGQQTGVSLFMLLEAAFHVLLFRWTGQEDLAVGTPVAGRTRREVEGLIGCFVNTLVIRARVEARDTFGEVLEAVKEACLGGYANQDLPFERLVEALNPPRDLARSPLFQVMFVLQNQPDGGDAPLPGGLRVAPLGMQATSVAFDLVLSAQEVDDTLEVGGDYATALFDRSTVERLLAAYAQLLGGIVARGLDTPVWRLPVMPDVARGAVEAWGIGAPVRGGPPLLHELVAEATRRAPGSIAVEDGAQRLSYRELDERANQLAHHLRGLGVGPETRVGICLERGMDLVVGILGILKAGGAYVPLDPQYPEERLRWMAGDARARLILVGDGQRAKVEGPGARLVCLDDLRDVLERLPRSQPELAPDPRSLAYVIYTSGSTGRPKGVMISHAAVVNTIAGLREVHGLGAHDAILHRLSFSFDASLWELFGALASGARLILAPAEQGLDARALLAQVERHRVTTLLLVPGMLQALVDATDVPMQGGPLARVVVGGERLATGLAQRARRQLGVEVIVEYGPTETAIAVTRLHWDGAERGPSLPIGGPTPGVRLAVLDAWLQPVGEGIVGELYVGGDQVGRGYWERPDLTAECFIPDPFAPGTGARMYRTGDRVRWHRGMLEILGRADGQLKLRGFRIEPREIEVALESLAGVREAVVMLQGEGDDRRVVAYVVAEPGITVTGLRDALRAELPAHLVPTGWMQLTALPRSPNGKVDRGALPPLEIHATSGDFESPRGPLEELVAQVWGQALGLERVGRGDDFFALGGHSLLATRMGAELRARLGFDFPLRLIFEATTVQQFSRAIEQERAAGTSGGPRSPAELEPSLPLRATMAQARQWRLATTAPGRPESAIPWGLRVQASLPVGDVTSALHELVERHVALRTGVRAEGQQLLLEPLPLPWVEMDAEDLGGLPGDLQRARMDQAAREDVLRPFDVAAGPLVRARSFRLGASETAVLVTTHHVAADGDSVGLLAAELTASLAARASGTASAAVPVAEAGAAPQAWEAAQRAQPPFRRQLEFWRTQLEGARGMPLPGLADAGPEVAPVEGSIPIALPRELEVGLRAACAREGVTPYMFLLAAYQLLLSDGCDVPDVVVGTFIDNRDEAWFPGVVGDFSNLLPLRSRIVPDDTFRAHLARTRQAVLAAFAHREVCWEAALLPDDGDLTAALPRFWEVTFHLRPVHVGDAGPEEGLVAPLELELGLPKGLLALDLDESAGGLRGALSFNAARLDARTVRSLATGFLRILAGAVEDPARPMARLVAGLRPEGLARKAGLDGK